MCTIKKFLMFIIYVGFIAGIIIGMAFPIWLIGWVLFIGLLLCTFSHLLF